MLQALSSERRAARRAEKKKLYRDYLFSAAWKKIRAEILKRDEHRCRGCGEKATQVHHMRYPNKLGQERHEWLFSVCKSCHEEIHRRTASGMPLRHATTLVLTGQLDPPRKGKKKKSRLKKMKVNTGANLTKKIQRENDELHALQVRNREKRALRAEAQRPRIEVPPD